MLTGVVVVSPLPNVVLVNDFVKCRPLFWCGGDDDGLDAVYISISGAGEVQELVLVIEDDLGFCAIYAANVGFEGQWCGCCHTCCWRGGCRLLCQCRSGYACTKE